MTLHSILIASSTPTPSTKMKFSIALFITYITSISAQGCSWAPDGAGVTYDMTKLQESGPYFMEGGDLE